MKAVYRAGRFCRIMAFMCFSVMSLYMTAFPLQASDIRFTTIYTPNGTAIFAGEIQNEWSADEIRELNRKQEQAFPYAWKIREPSRRYNCHSYAWYSQSPGNTIWIGFQEIYQDEYKKYWEDGSYVAITTVTGDINAIPYAAPAGAKVFYNNGNHSAIKAGTHTFVSKWGNMGLYEHIPDDCPYISDSVTYYKRNK